MSSAREADTSESATFSEVRLRGLQADACGLAELERGEPHDIGEAEPVARDERAIREQRVNPLPFLECIGAGQYAVLGHLGDAAHPETMGMAESDSMRACSSGPAPSRQGSGCSASR